MRHSIKIILLALTLFLLGAAIAGGIFYYRNLRGSAPAFSGPAADISTMLPASPSVPANNTNIPLKLPDGFSISIFAKALPGARVLVFDGLGNMWVSQASAGTISEIEIKDGKPAGQKVVFKNLRNPHGLAIDGNALYFAEEDKISRVNLYPAGSPQKIIDLPAGGRHTTRTLGLGPDGLLYVSIGSSCDVCNEQDPRRAAIYSMNKDGGNFKLVAGGLRNSVFFIWNQTKQMWATEMGHDYLGDNTPPDEIDVIEPGKNYGWPICYGQNIHDTNFDKNTYIQDPCNGKVPARADIPAHSAPLGLGFVPADSGWPSRYQNNLLVAYHGSWNRSQPTGYKIVSMKFDTNGNYQGTEDFITGWLQKNNALGRPVDVIFSPSGILYISDDKAGVIYRVQYGNSQK